MFAMYSRSVRAPTSVETRLLELAVHIAGIAIARRRAEERIQFMASHDALTGLPNRSRLGEQMAEALLSGGAATARGCASPMSTSTTSSTSTTASATAPATSCSRPWLSAWSPSSSPDDMMGRLGGDEFVVALIDPPKDTVQIGATLHRIRTAVIAPVEIEGRSFRDHRQHRRRHLSQGRRVRRDA